MRPIRVTVGPLTASSANNIALTQTPTSGTALTLNGSLVSGGVATLDKPRQVLLTFGNEASNRTLVITGTTFNGNSASETLSVTSGAGGTVASVLDYATVTSAVPAGGGWTAAVTLGTNSIAGSKWTNLDAWALPQTMIQAVVSGTANYTIQLTQDDPDSLSDPVGIASVAWSNSSDPAVVAASTTQLSSLSFCPAWVRVLLNSGTGSVTTTFTQSGSVPL